MQSTQELVSLAEQHLYPNYRQPSVVIDHGQGSTLWDTDGRRYIDLYAGVAVSALGHGHPALVQAISAQAAQLIHQSNYFYSAPNVKLAEALCRLTGMDRVLFSNSGTEANEAALKLCRRHFFNLGQTNRYQVISFDNSFHGRTLGSLAVTGQAKYSEGFGPIGGAVLLPFGDLAAVEAALDDTVCAIITEPVQGEGGVVPPPPGFLKGLRALADKSGALLILDEIQTGAGRTGAFLSCQNDGVVPDVVTMAKGLGGGVPIGAMLTTEALSVALPPGTHGSTFGGNPLASAAALAVIETIESEGLLERAKTLGGILSARLSDMAVKYRAASHQRGQGLLQALVLHEQVGEKAITAGDVSAKLRDKGVLVITAGGNALRFAPALTITDAELNEGLTLLEGVLSEI